MSRVKGARAGFGPERSALLTIAVIATSSARGPAAEVGPTSPTELQPARAARNRRARFLDASPNVPVFGLEFRGAARATLAGEMPLCGHRSIDSWAVLVVPLVELFNEPHPDSILPNEYWRGRLGAEIWWTPAVSSARPVQLGLTLEHESDHTTARYGSKWGFFSLNDLALRQLTVFDKGPVAFSIGLDLNLYFGSCTRVAEECHATGGASTVGAGMTLGADFGAGASWLGWHPFVASHASAILANGEVAREERWVMHVGGWHPGPGGDLWQVFGLLFVGNDVGIRRSRVLHQLGIGIRWSPP